MENMIIPKKIHYCWFGKGKKNELSKKCISSWKKYLPEYELVEWNETNFDIHMNAYIEEAYHAQKWAFITDFVRLYVLYHEGGVYMDTDVEVLRPLDIFLQNEAFSGFESRDSVPTGIMAAVKYHPVIKDLLRDYKGRHFLQADGTYDMTTNVTLITKYFVQNGLHLNNKEQIINNYVMYPQIYFCPNTLGMIFGIPSSKSYTIHHFDGSWKDDRRKKNLKYRLGHFAVGKIKNAIGTDNYIKIRGKRYS